MRVLAVALFVLLAAPDRYELRHRFEKGMVTVDEQTRTYASEVFAETRIVRWRIETEIRVRRTVLAVGEDGMPSIERIEVERWRFHTREHPEREPGSKADPGEGGTFVWRRMDDGWRLFAEGDRDVTGDLDALVGYLSVRSDARLPDGPVAVGASWEVGGREILQSNGVGSLEGMEGRARFTLESVDDEGVATITFEMTFTQQAEGIRQGGRTTGSMRFDVERGRDLSSTMSGRVQLDGGDKGFVELGLDRKLTYPAPGR